MNEPWKPNGEPFCWQPKSQRRKIREAFDAENKVASRLLTYDTLTEISSDEQSAEFTTTYAHVAMRSGQSVRTVQAAVKDLSQLPLCLHFSVPKLRAPGRYRLLYDAQPLPNVTQQLPNVKQPMPNDRQRSKQGTMPGSEESLEESPEKSSSSSAGKQTESNSFAAIPTVEEVIAFGAKYPGDLARGVPGPIPKDFCVAYHEAKEKQQTWLNRNGQLIKWQLELVGKGWWRDQWRTWGKDDNGRQGAKPELAPDDWRNCL